MTLIQRTFLTYMFTNTDDLSTDALQWCNQLKCPNLLERHDVHDVLWCVKCDSEILPLLQLNAAVQTGGAPQLRDPVHCSLTQGAVHPHPGWQAHIGTENTETSYSLLTQQQGRTQFVIKSLLSCVVWMYLGLMYPAREKWDVSL